MKLTISQKADSIFKIYTNGNKYTVNEENPTVCVDMSDTCELFIEEIDEHKKPTFCGMLLYALTQAVIIIARVLFLAQPDWRENVDPFLLKCKVNIPKGLTELKLKYNEGGYYKKNDKLYEPTMITHDEGVVLETFSKPNYRAVRNTYVSFMINYVFIGVLAVGLLSFMLAFSSEPLNAGITILTWVIIVVITLVIVGVLLCNRGKYREWLEKLKKHEE